MPSPIYDPDSPSLNPDAYWPDGEDRDFARGNGSRVNIEVRTIELNGQIIDSKKLYKALAPILQANAKKIVERAKKYAYENAKGGKNPLERREHIPLREGMKIGEPQIYGEDGIDLPIRVISRHAAPVEFGSGLYNTNRFRTRSTQYPETQGGTKRIVAGGRFYITPRKSGPRAFILVPLQGQFRPTPRKSGGRRQRKYSAFKEEQRRTIDIGGVRYIFVAYSKESGQKQKKYLRTAVSDYRLALLQDLRYGIARILREQLSDPKNANVDLTVSVS